MKFLKNIYTKYTKKCNYNENKPVLSFLSKLPQDNYTYLEIGSGLGKFTKIIKKYFNYNITCLEINKNLAQKTEKNGFKTINESIVSTTIPNNTFDIIHCAHVIEHLNYPDIINAIEKMIGILKDEGFLIIRSPLMNPKFFNDIDHIRPYPPAAIINYFNNTQQQKKSFSKIEIINTWYRYPSLQINNTKNRFFIKLSNYIFKILWILFNFPSDKANGYTIIIKKNNLQF
jgi:2-polyprenyl-3-methyl-5-hydroxy-6-metoxy-1,4-benzoquinol methylase